MAVYQKHFSYNNRNNTEFGLRVITFTPDNGEMDSFLSVESIYTENFNGTMRHDYGAKYKGNAMLYITMVKNNYSDFSRMELREIVSWLTGLRKVSWLDLYNDDTRKISFSFLGRVTDIKLQKMDARIVGLKVEFESISPWAYSGINRYDITLDGSRMLYPLRNCSDEDSVYTYPKVVFTNKVPNGSLRIFNTTTREETLLNNLKMNEVVTMDSNQIIYSDNTTRVFGDDFNYKWLRFSQGYNNIEILGTGHLTIEYREIFKIAEAFDDNDDMNIIATDKNALLLTRIKLSTSNWTEETVRPEDMPKYSQVLSIPEATIHSKIDLQPTEEQLLEIQNKKIELQIVNDNGTIIAYSYGGVPTVDYVIQATIEETNLEIPYRYASVTLYADTWYNQGDIYYQPIYIKGVTRRSIVDIILTDAQVELLDDNSATLFIKNNLGETIAYAIGYKPESDYTVDLIIRETTNDPTKVNQMEIEEEIYAEPLYF